MTLIHFATPLLLGTLIALAVIDARTQRLPDLLTLPLIEAGIAVNGLIYLHGGLQSLAQHSVMACWWPWN